MSEPNGDGGVEAFDASFFSGLEDALALDATRCHARKLASSTVPAREGAESPSSSLPLAARGTGGL